MKAAAGRAALVAQRLLLRRLLLAASAILGPVSARGSVESVLRQDLPTSTLDWLVMAESRAWQVN